MVAVTVHSDFGAQENKICYCFHFFPNYLLWSDGTGWEMSMNANNNIGSIIEQLLGTRHYVMYFKTIISLKPLKLRCRYYYPCF